MNYLLENKESNNKQNDALIEWQTSLYKDLRPYMSGETYQNYPSMLLGKEKYLETSYGSNLDKLVELKKKYDKNGLFFQVFGIPLS